MANKHFVTYALVGILTVLFLAAGCHGWVEQRLIPGQPVQLIGDLLRLTRSHNSGIAFGLLQDSRLVPWLSALALVVVGRYLLQSVQQYRLGHLSVGLIVGGGLANLLDRLDDGHVTDYIDVGVGAWRFATFNLPDAAVFLGMALSLWLLINTRKEPVWIVS